MNASEELEFLPPEYRDKVQKALRESVPMEIEKCSGNPYSTKQPVTTTVFVTFYTDFDKKVIRTELGPRDSLDELARKASELFPGHKWRIFSGTQWHAECELLNYTMAYEAIKSTHHWDFHYLLIHLKPADTVFVSCDSCRQSIHGHRFKCTECADFDICGRCEARSVHSDHAMLRIVNSGTHIPRYITDNSPSAVFA